MATELIKTRCTQGKLIITDEYIRVQLAGIQQRTMSRSTLIGVDSAMAVPSVFGIGGATNLIFRGQGDAIQANFVNTKKAKEILELLGY